MHEEAQGNKPINLFLKKRTEKEIKETKESDLPSEQQWPKNVDNIWVKIIHMTKKEWKEKT